MTYEEAIEWAKKYNLEIEVTLEMVAGATPEDALREWDIL